VFDNQMLAQCVYFGFRIGEISCPTKYFPEASSVNLKRSLKYGAEVLVTTLQYYCQVHRIWTFPIFDSDGHRLVERGAAWQAAADCQSALRRLAEAIPAATPHSVESSRARPG